MDLLLQERINLLWLGRCLAVVGLYLLNIVSYPKQWNTCPLDAQHSSSRRLAWDSHLLIFSLCHPCCMSVSVGEDEYPEPYADHLMTWCFPWSPGFLQPGFPNSNECFQSFVVLMKLNACIYLRCQQKQPAYVQCIATTMWWLMYSICPSDSKRKQNHKQTGSKLWGWWATDRISWRKGRKNSNVWKSRWRSSDLCLHLKSS